ncbi:exportin 7 [Anaeramoeba flamelloides]|uniref:Exportin 7 n=1 Tax=Anaeramoeba flamelloides TaxID=1746091 RepID=A0ABQ8ZBP2_9EUKA|nr:exportin 7 [Anaeramoeba flamelloides]
MDLSTIETLSTNLVNGTDRKKRQEAEDFFKKFSQRKDFLNACIEILDTSQNSYLLWWVGTEMGKHFVVHFHSYESLSLEKYQKVLLKFLEKRWESLEHYVLVVYFVTFSKIVKLNWDDPNQHNIVKTIYDSIDCNNELNLLVILRIMYHLVEQFDLIIYERETLLEYHQRSSSFRDNSLFQIYEFAVSILSKYEEDFVVQMQEEKHNEVFRKLVSYAFALFSRCLSYSFRGNSPERVEPASDRHLIWLPHKWFQIIADRQVVGLAYNYYDNSQDLGPVCLRAIFHLCSIHQSVLSECEKGDQFITQIVEGLLSVIQNQKIISKFKKQSKTESMPLYLVENFHELCKVIYKIQINFPIKNLLKIGSFLELVEEFTEITYISFQNIDFQNSEYYLLHFWGKIGNSIKLFHNPNSSNKDNNKYNNENGNDLKLLKNYLFEILKTFLQILLEEIKLEEREEEIIEDFENPFDENSRFLINLEPLSWIGLSNYPETATLLNELFDKSFNMYKKSMIKQSGSPHCKIHGTQLSIFLYYIGELLVSKRSHSTKNNKHRELIDTELSIKIFQLIEWNDSFLYQSEQEGIDLLEIGIIKFLINFSSIYLKSRFSEQSIVYENFKNRLKISNKIELLSVIFNKVINNFKNWTKNEQIIKSNLLLFSKISQMYRTGRLILKLQNINNLFLYHTSFNFPFLDYYSDKKWYRSNFYKILSKLLFLEDQKSTIQERFFYFVKPFEKKAQQITQIMENDSNNNNNNTNINDNNTQNKQKMIIGFIKDIKGMLQAIPNPTCFCAFFDWVFPNYTELFHNIFNHYSDSYLIVINCLKFWKELTTNTTNRIKFPSYSPNGVYLFQIITTNIYKFCLHLTNKSNSQSNINQNNNRFQNNSKLNFTDNQILNCFRLIVETLCSALSAEYINLGVFELYKDDTLQKLIHLILNFSLSFSIPKMLPYPKLYVAYYSFIQILSNVLIKQLLIIEDQLFVDLFQSLIFGLELINEEVWDDCFTSLNSILEFYFINHNNKYNRNEETKYLALNLDLYFEKNSDLLPYLLKTLMNKIILEYKYDKSLIIKPILPLLFICQNEFIQYTEQIVSRVHKSQQSVVANIIQQVGLDINENLEFANREKFEKQVHEFRKEIRKFDVHEK